MGASSLSIQGERGFNTLMDTKQPRSRRGRRERRTTVAVAGLGLVGGSLARALTRAGYRVIGVDRPEVLAQAEAARAVAAGVASIEACAWEADILVLAAPPAVNRRLLRRVARLRRPRLVVTDVGSVKGAIVAEARRLGLRCFVGGHPMAGNEGSGFAAGHSGLFRDRPWLLTPRGSEPRAVRAVERLARAVGARPVVLTPEAHDRAVAFLSHVPQLTAWALASAARGDAVTRRYLEQAGPGFRDMTRLAASSRSLWRDILLENRQQVKRALASMMRSLARELPRSRSRPRAKTATGR
jgi:prephenate dehydrogenase